MVIEGGEAGGMVGLNRIVDCPVLVIPVPGGLVGPGLGGFEW